MAHNRSITAFLFFMLSIIAMGTPHIKSAEMSVPTKPTAIALIYGTIITLNNASRAGDFSIMRELASPEFQAKYSSADLSVAFSSLIEKQIDLLPTIMITPRIDAAIYSTSDKVVRFKGAFTMRVMVIDFEIHYQWSGSRWQLHVLTLAFNNPKSPEIES